MTAYSDLLSSIQSRGEPRGGWYLAGLPKLTDADLAACLTKYPAILNDFVLDAGTMIDCLTGSTMAGMSVEEYVTMAVRTQLADDARKLILSDLRERAEDAEVNAYAAGVIAEAR